MALAISVGIYVSIFLLLTGVQYLTAPRPARDRLLALASSGAAAEKRSGFDRHVRPTIIKLPARLPFLRGFVRDRWVAAQLVYAGQPYGLDVEQFYGLQLLGGLAGLFASAYFAILGLFGGYLSAPFLAALGFYLPNWWLSGRANARQQQITLELPTFLDLLVVCMGAGQGFDQAVASIAGRLKGPLAEELERFLHEVSMGEPRRAALQHVVDRTTAKDLQTFIAALIQAEDLGVPLATTLEVQAQEIRFRRAQRAKDLAAKAASKIALVLVVLVAPAALCLMVTAMASGIFHGGVLGGIGR